MKNNGPISQTMVEQGREIVKNNIQIDGIDVHTLKLKELGKRRPDAFVAFLR